MKHLGKIRGLITILLLLIITWFLWLPQIEKIRLGLAELKNSSHIIETRTQGLANTRIGLEERRVDFVSAWDKLKSKAYRVNSSIVAGTNLIAFIQEQAVKTQVELVSATLLPVTEHEGMNIVAADVKAYGGVDNVFAFLGNITNSQPVHVIEDLRLDAHNRGQINLDLRLAAILFIEPTAQTEIQYLQTSSVKVRTLEIFGSLKKQHFDPEWEVIGLVSGLRNSSAMLKHRATGKEEIVRVGDMLDLWVVSEIGKDYVLLLQAGEQFYLAINP